MSLNDKVDKIMSKAIKKNQEQINNALIEPLTPEYQFSTNGIYFFLRPHVVR